MSYVAMMRADEHGAAWREDATNADTDRFRAFVRHEIVPRQRAQPRLLETLTRTMNLIAEEDDMLIRDAACFFLRRWFRWEHRPEGFLVSPALADSSLPLFVA
ncbi:MAG: hypothetical protein ACLT98_02435 [Eggerthellaceae bacterium]